MAYRGGVGRRWVMSQVLLWSLALSAIPATAADYLVRPLPFTEVTLTDGLWGQRQETNRRVTLPFAIDQCESSQRLRNFDLAAETLARRARARRFLVIRPQRRFRLMILTSLRLSRAPPIASRCDPIRIFKNGWLI